MSEFHLILTLDYELFGNGSGCLEHCVLRPTNFCLDTLRSFNAPLALFVDASEFRALRRYPAEFGQGMEKVETQLRQASLLDHSLQLHLHPQWLGAEYHDGEWQLDMSKWRIGDLTSTDVEQCVNEGMEYLKGLVANGAQNNREHLSVFRAGGWAIQSSHKVIPILKTAGINLESTVAPKAYNPAGGDWYDFRRCPELPCWPIDGDVCAKSSEESSELLEVPITTAKVSKYDHYKALKENRGGPAFPSGCQGSYTGANSRGQELVGKLSKLLRLGNVMLDFSTMPAWMLIEITKQHLKRFAYSEQPVPVVAIGHNKNFTERSNQHLRSWLEWVTAEPSITFSSYYRWHSAYKEG